MPALLNPYAVAAAGLTTYVQDNFNRADATSIGAPQVGPTPTVIKRPSGSGSWGISSNKLYPVSSLAENAALWDIGVTDYVMTSVMSAIPTDGGLLCRAASDGSVWQHVYAGLGTTWGLYDWNGAAYTQLITSGAMVPTAGDSLELTVRSTSIRLRVNGADAIWFPTTSGAAQTRLGFRDQGTAARFDDLLATSAPTLPTVRINDPFTRADGVVGVSPQGPIGNPLNQSWAIASNKLAPANASEAVISWATDAAEFEMEFTVSSLNADPGGCVRMLDKNNFILAQMNTGGTSAIYKRVAGSYTALTTPTSISWASGDTVRIVNTLTAITVYRNGSQVMTVTDSTHSGAPGCGFRANSSTVRFDDLLVTAL